MNLLSNLNLKTHRTGFGFGTLVFALFFGAAFMSVGYFKVQDMRIPSGWSKVSGTVIDEKVRSDSDGTFYSPIVEYEVDGKKYTTIGSTYTSSHVRIGSGSEVAHNPTLPSQGKVISGMWDNAFLWLFPLIGLAVALWGVISFIASLVRGMKIKRLVARGTKLTGVVSNIQSTSDKGYRVEVSATDTNNMVQTYMSDAMKGWGGAALFDFKTNPIPVDVYVNPTNPREYYVDIADLPSLTADRIRDLINSARRDPDQFQ